MGKVIIILSAMLFFNGCSGTKYISPDGAHMEKLEVIQPTHIRGNAECIGLILALRRQNKFYRDQIDEVNAMNERIEEIE